MPVRGLTNHLTPGLRSSGMQKNMTDLGKPGQVGDSVMNTFLASQIKTFSECHLLSSTFSAHSSVQGWIAVPGPPPIYEP